MMAKNRINNLSHNSIDSYIYKSPLQQIYSFQSVGLFDSIYAGLVFVIWHSKYQLINQHVSYSQMNAFNWITFATNWISHTIILYIQSTWGERTGLWSPSSSFILSVPWQVMPSPYLPSCVLWWFQQFCESVENPPGSKRLCWNDVTLLYSTYTTK